MEIKLSTLQYPTEFFTKLKNKSTDQRDLLTAIGQLMKNSVYDNFQTEGARLGSAWLPLSPKYARAKLKKYGNKPILQRDQRLLNSIISTEPKVDTNSVTIGTNVQYARIHHFGGLINIGARSEIFTRIKNKRGKFKTLDPGKRQFAKGYSFRSYTIRIPARPFMQLNQLDLQSINDHLRAWLTK